MPPPRDATTRLRLDPASEPARWCERRARALTSRARTGRRRPGDRASIRAVVAASSRSAMSAADGSSRLGTSHSRIVPSRRAGDEVVGVAPGHAIDRARCGRAARGGAWSPAPTRGSSCRSSPRRARVPSGENATSHHEVGVAAQDVEHAAGRGVPHPHGAIAHRRRRSAAVRRHRDAAGRVAAGRQLDEPLAVDDREAAVAAVHHEAIASPARTRRTRRTTRRPCRAGAPCRRRRSGTPGRRPARRSGRRAATAKPRIGVGPSSTTRAVAGRDVPAAQRAVGRRREQRAAVAR